MKSTLILKDFLLEKDQELEGQVFHMVQEQQVVAMVVEVEGDLIPSLLLMHTEQYISLKSMVAVEVVMEVVEVELYVLMSRICCV